MQDAEARIVIVKNEIDVIGRLLCDLDATLITRRILDHLLAAGEDPQQAWDDRLDRVPNLGHHDLAAALFLVAE